VANLVIRNAPVFFKSKKIAEIETASYEVNSGDEAQIGTDGYLGHSQGAITTKLDCNVIVPVAGLKTTMMDALLRKLDVNIGAFVDGKLHQFDARCTTARFDSDSRAGKLTGTFTFEGGEPRVT
jgi:hypothetical protein